MLKIGTEALDQENDLGLQTTDYGRESTELYMTEAALVSLEREPKEGLALKAVKEGAIGKHLWLADSGAS